MTISIKEFLCTAIMPDGRVCGKRRFATKEAAERVIQKMQNTRDRTGGKKVESRAYYDHGPEPFGWYHISSQERSRNELTQEEGQAS